MISKTTYYKNNNKIMYKDYLTKKERLHRTNTWSKFLKYLKTANNFKLIL
jgi:hypothetical protein